MKKTKEYSKDEIVYFLKTKGCEFSGVGETHKIIGVSKAKGLGNNSWGKLDFLLNYHGYFLSAIRS